MSAAEYILVPDNWTEGVADEFQSLKENTSQETMTLKHYGRPFCLMIND